MKNNETDDQDMGRVLSRMALGAIVGGIAVYLFQTEYARHTGFTEDRVNPYISGTPTMETVLWTAFGAIIGSFCGLVSRHWKSKQ